jgi:hypothetical protein
MRDATQFFKALAEESRLKMLWLLFNNEELCVRDIIRRERCPRANRGRAPRARARVGLCAPQASPNEAPAQGER